MAINFLLIPQGLADKLGLALFGGQILASIIVLFLVLTPTIILAKGRRGGIFELFMGFVTMGFLVSIEWLPSFLFVILFMIVGLGYAGEIRNLITGK